VLLSLKPKEDVGYVLKAEGARRKQAADFNPDYLVKTIEPARTVQ